jgi:hypothetical protein
MAEHLIEILSRAFQLKTITLAAEDFHRVLDGIELVEELGDGLTELCCIRSTGLLIHSHHVGIKALLFKALTPAGVALTPQTGRRPGRAMVSMGMVCRRWRK